MAVLNVLGQLLLAVLFHEAGHAVAAIRLGFRVKGFAIGIPFWPKAKFVVRGYEVTVSPWLIGAGVDIADADYFRQSWWKKVIVAVAGPLANVVLAVLGAIYILGPLGALGLVWGLMVMIFSALVGLFSGAVPIGEVASLAKFFEVTSPIVGSGTEGAMFIWILLNLVLAVTNLLPVPAMDGGNVVFAVLGGILGEPAWLPKFQKGLSLVMLVLLVGVTVVLVARDILLL